MIRQCPNCLEDFQPKDRWSPTKYCSPACREEGQTKTLSCAICDQEFRAKSWAKYCSRECRDTAKKVQNGAGRFDVFNRDGCRCIYCGETSEGRSLNVEHIVPVSKGGKDIASNLVTACGQCNRGRANKELTEGTIKYVQDVVSRRNERDSIPHEMPVKLAIGAEARRSR